MSKVKLKKEKWTLSFDRNLKEEVIEEAKRQGVYPVHLLESLVREKFNPFGHADIKNELAYVRKLRKADKEKNDEAFLEEYPPVGENQFLVDTDILIAYLNHRTYRSYLENPLNRIYYSAMTKKELLSKPGAGSELVDGQTRFFNLKISFQAGQKGFRCEARDG